MDINELILELFGGAFTGYMTNSIAIKMLFKNYGPFGGVIVKTKEEFIKNISQLVERDLINENTLEDSLNQTEVKNSIRNMVEHFFSKSLKTRVENIKIKEIPGIKKTTDNFIIILEDITEKHFRKGFQMFLPQIRFKEIISNKQYDYISGQLISRLIYILNSSEQLKIYFNSLLSRINNKKINSLLAPNLINILAGNIKNNFREIEKNPENLNEHLNTLYGNLNQYLNIDQLNIQLIEQIQDKKLNEYHINADYLSNIIDNLNKFINSRTGKRVIGLNYENLTGYLRKNKLSISSLVDMKLNDQIHNLTYKKVTGILKVLGPWLRKNETTIDNTFNRIITKTLKEESRKSPLKTAIKRSAYEYYRKNSSTSPTEILSNTVNTLISKQSIKNKLNNYTDKQLNSFQLIDILEYLSNNLIRDNQLSGKNSIDKIHNSSINTNQTENIVNEISSYLNQYLLNLDKDIFKDISENSISEIIDLNNFDLDSFFRVTINNKNIQKYLLDLILNNIDKEIDNTGNKRINSLINMENSNIYYEKIIASIRKNQNLLQHLSRNKFYNKIKNKTLDGLINPQIKETGILNLKKLLSVYFGEFFKSNKGYKLDNLFAGLNKKIGFNKKVTDNIIVQLNSNLPLLLKGNISAAIKNNLENVSDGDMKNMVENFVGKELKPITYFGAFLGICSASLLYLLQVNTDFLSSIQLPLSMVVYGFIGYITNVIAIKMVFRPYNKKKLLGLPLPFTPGVISKEKDRFARSVGKFIDEELLNYDTVKNTITNKKTIIHDMFTRSLTADNYHLPKKLLRKNSDKLSSISFNYLRKNKNKTGKYIVNKLENPELISNNPELLNSISNSTASSVEQYIEDNIPRFSTTLLEWLKEKDDLASLIPEPVKNSINQTGEKVVEKKLESITALLRDKGNKRFDTILIELINNFFGQIKNKSIADLPEEIIKILNNALYNIFKTIIIYNGDTLQSKLNTGINSFNNKTGLISNKIVELLSANKTELKNIIMRETKSKMGFWSTAGKLVDFDETLSKFADTFIEEGVPEILKLFLNDEIEAILRELNLAKENVTVLLEGLFNNQNFREIIIENLDYLIETLSFISLGDLLKLLEIEQLANTIKPFNEEIELIKSNLSIGLYNNQNDLITEIIKVFNDLLENYLYSINIDKLLKGIEKNMINESLEKLYRKMNKDNILHNSLQKVIKDIILFNSNKDQILDFNCLKKDLDRLLTTILNNKQFSHSVHKLIDEIYIDLIDQIPGIIDKKTANYLINILISSILNTLEIGLPELMEKINIKDISVSEIENMDSREIETLFYSFAGNYFGKLENYGWLGSIIGLISELLKDSI